ncbi:MAG: AMP-binding protein [Massilibacteroides sp.]|nr:AMP-binding protein [Massilibacteroides sp.]MDD3061715.1 AMP-binding protein [Massilibacteroides sp.]MDD4114322.1 AMP-binding protein [Massilibacteroides sp.]MDD4660598.1 AMP-binding protein [Massilibacteroides sp.]
MNKADLNTSESITIEGIVYGKADFEKLQKPSFTNHSPFHEELYWFIKEWFSSSSVIEVQTSGSTGKPKKMKVSKVRMWHSAKTTCDFLRLKTNDKALLCLPLTYIAGKMMVVRAIHIGLNIYPVEPTGHPLSQTDITFDFAAMIPLQIYNSLQVAEEKSKLSKIKQLIIGGSSIDKKMEEALSGFPNPIYSTYGMTETLSHIALRRINGSEACLYYTPFESVQLSLSDDNTLQIDAPLVCKERLVTNDIAEIRPNGHFRILGRKDNRINSGGIKIQIEEIEQNLRPYLAGQFAVTSIPDPRLGEAIVLLVESDDPKIIYATIRQWLPHYQQPRQIFRIEHLPLTETGKPDRAAIKKIAGQICPTYLL